MPFDRAFLDHRFFAIKVTRGASTSWDTAHEASIGRRSPSCPLTGSAPFDDCQRCIEGFLQVVEELFDLAPRNTYITITSDHGELFGEDGYFGHGPIQHEKVFEVFFTEGKLR